MAGENIEIKLNTISQAIVISGKRFSEKKGWVLSSHIAMSLMLALFPFALFTVSLAGALTDLSSQSFDILYVMDLLFGSWPQAVADPIKSEVLAVLDASGVRLVTFSGVVTLYFASNGVDAIRLAIVSAYHEDDRRPFWKNRLICLALVLMGGAGILAATLFELLLPLALNVLQDRLPGVDADFMRRWQNGLSGVLILCLPISAVLLFHIFLPDRVHHWRDIVAGVLFTVVLWWVAGVGFAYYVASFAQYSATYAGLAGAMVALVFLYLNAAILILGAELNGALLDLRAAA